MNRSPRRLAGVLWLVTLTACGSATDSSGARLAAGKWLYHASVGQCKIVGVLTISEAGSAIKGRMPTAGSFCMGAAGYFTLDPDSSVQVVGRVEGDSAIFTMSGWGSELRHSAPLTGDSVAGSISAPASSWIQGPGTFAARRYQETPAGRFQLVVSGAVNDTVEGPTYANQFGVYMARDDDLIRFELTESTDPTPYPAQAGSWKVHPYRATEDSLTAWLYLKKSNRIFSADDGSVSITAVTDGFIQGSFEIHAHENGDPARTVTIRGNFVPHYDPIL